MPIFRYGTYPAFLWIALIGPIMDTNRHMVSVGAALCLTLWLSNSMAEQDALQAELLRCAALPAETERVKCYDALAQRDLRPTEPGAAGKREEPKPVEDPPLPPEPVTEPSSAQTVEITDEVGREQVGDSDDAKATAYSARVTSCQKNSSGRVFFFLDNGQIWKQTDYARIRYRECDFDVTLTRDAFGYKLKVVDKKSSYRVSRVK